MAVRPVSHLVSHQQPSRCVLPRLSSATSLLLWGKTTPVSAGASDYGSEAWGLLGELVTWCQYRRQQVIRSRRIGSHDW
jgi:hypothetical protein